MAPKRRVEGVRSGLGFSDAIKEKKGWGEPLAVMNSMPWPWLLQAWAAGGNAGEDWGLSLPPADPRAPPPHAAPLGTSTPRPLLSAAVLLSWANSLSCPDTSS